jgi:antitoxin (DNA-binding transcriptional repressor) of toxin-antitoxin stability system
MERASVRDLHLKTSALIKNVAQGQTYVIESRSVPVAELASATKASTASGRDTGHPAWGL